MGRIWVSISVTSPYLPELLRNFQKNGRGLEGAAWSIDEGPNQCPAKWADRGRDLLNTQGQSSRGSGVQVEDWRLIAEEAIGGP